MMQGLGSGYFESALKGLNPESSILSLCFKEVVE